MEDKIVDKKISPELDNFLGRSVAELVDEHLSAVRDLILNNIEGAVGFRATVTPNSDDSYKHKVEICRSVNNPLDNESVL